MTLTLPRTIGTPAAFVGPFFSYSFGGRISPVPAGYRITHRCNLRCRHCPYWKRSGLEQDISGVFSALESLSGMWVRILILEGGEPLLWRDRDKTIRNVIHEARKLFPSVCLTTNGTLPWGDLPLDRVWISLDGPRSIHDAIRGEGTFDRILVNLDREGKGRALVHPFSNTVTD